MLSLLARLRCLAFGGCLAVAGGLLVFQPSPAQAGIFDGIFSGGAEADASTTEREKIIAALAESPPLPDYPEGDPNAPVTLVEFSSLTCPHCASFHRETLKVLRQKYVKTGVVQVIQRDFPLAPLATAAALLARCVAENGPEASAGARHRAILDTLFARQAVWSRSQQPLDDLVAIARQVGFGRDKVEACFQREDLLRRLNAAAALASDVFEVESTPTFFINGTRLVGARPLKEFEAAIEEALNQ